ncbi:hypothetical protein ABHN05_11370 [Brevibacillus laterosporus]|uniref:hypothetical protein n=1 Tax=Brevibacillus laterosporus TaxID=1465 RepID=UPI001175C305|nr:hypothetical protein [Brevibacillus laterosporus]TPH15923.1 hypothetical protein EGH09_11250 [Brevibacillus laterosporus]
MEPSEVQSILGQFSGVELKKANEINKESDSPYFYNVIIRQKSDDSEVYSFMVYNQKSTSMRENNHTHNYTITNDFDFDAFRASIDKLYSAK